MREEEIDGLMSWRSQEREGGTRSIALPPPHSPSPANLTSVAPGAIEGIQASEGGWGRWRIRFPSPRTVNTVSIHLYCAMWPTSTWWQTMWRTSLKYSLVSTTFHHLPTPAAYERWGEPFVTNSTCFGMWPKEGAWHNRKKYQIGSQESGSSLSL